MFRNARLLFGKELLGAFRDRRTLFLTVLFPLIFYPLVLSVMSQFGEAERTRLDTLVPTVLVVDRSGDETFARELVRTDAFTFLSFEAFDEAKAASILDVPKHLRPVAMLPIGFPAEPSNRIPPRRKLEDVVTYK